MSAATSPTLELNTGVTIPGLDCRQVAYEGVDAWPGSGGMSRVGGCSGPLRRAGGGRRRSTHLSGGWQASNDT